MEIKAIKTGIFRENEDLARFIFKYVKKIPENSVLVITSKIVALSEGRVGNLQEKERLIRKESKLAVKTGDTWLTLKDNMILPAAGIDESNGNGRLVLLPKDNFRTAKMVRDKLKSNLKVKNLGVIISDSGLLPLRNGVIGMALGYAGFEGVKSYKGQKDIFGRKFKYQKTNMADGLATAAALCMGEGRERRPLAIITGADIVFKKSVNKKEITINPKKDIFYPMLKQLFNAKKH